MCNMSILLIGSSHIKWFEKYFIKTEHLANFNLQEVTSVHFKGIGGGKINDVNHVQIFEKAIIDYKPTSVILQIGGNDLDKSGVTVSDAQTLALHIVAICNFLQIRHNIQKIICV